MEFYKQKYIYKITNKENGKIYIGQSNNPKIRFRSHMKKKSSSKSISEDVDSYGENSFTLEIIEPSDSFQEREKYWIKYYKDLGFSLYNKTKGGEEPPSKYGLDNKFTKYSDEDAIKIIDLLKNTNYNFRQIGKITKTTGDLVGHLNNGIRRINGYICDYPIRKESHFDKIAKLIIIDLKTTNITQKEISKKYGIARSMVTMINIGKNRYDEDLEYPIRKKRITDISQGEKDKIIHELKNGMSRNDAIEKYKRSDFINKINSKINKGLI